MKAKQPIAKLKSSEKNLGKQPKRKTQKTIKK